MRIDLKEENKKPKMRIMPKRGKRVDSQTPETSPKLEKPPKKKRITKPKVADENENRGRSSFSRHHPRTVRETQQMLRILNQSKENEEVEDEAVSTACFFKKLSPCRGATNQRSEVT